MIRNLTRAGSLFTIVGVLAISSGASTPASGQQPAQIVDVTVERFSFTPSEIRMKAGTPVEIRLRSEDTDHGFRIAGTEINITIPKRGRGTATVRFQPDKPGRYEFECSKLCGAGHAFMRGTIVAE
ncbi:MAG: cupredoxin domain-containing protein [Vicinamibacterales bacterium]|nr:cupredoxin domain-containing protein [Vicinamibacterales bacterium]